MMLYKPKLVIPKRGFIYAKNPYKTMLVYEFFISGEEYELCEEYSHKMGCNDKIGDYGKGHANTEKDPRCVERIGLLGEMAVAKWLDLEVNFSFSKTGFDIDFMLFDKYSIDVKTSFYKNNNVYVRKENVHGETMELKSMLYIFGFTNLIKEDKEKKTVPISLFGYEKKENILKWETGKNSAKVENYTAKYGNLQPIDKIEKACRKLKNAV